MCAVSKCLWHLYTAQAALTAFTARQTFPNEPPSLCRAESQANRMMEITSSQLGGKGFPGASVVKNLPANAGDLGLILRLGNPLEEEMVTHSSILAWEIPWTEKPGGLQSMGLQRVGYDWAGMQLGGKAALPPIALALRSLPVKLWLGILGFPIGIPVSASCTMSKSPVKHHGPRSPRFFSSLYQTLWNAYMS